MAEKKILKNAFHKKVQGNQQTMSVYQFGHWSTIPERHLNVSEKQDGKEKQEEGEESAKEKSRGGESRNC